MMNIVLNKEASKDGTFSYLGKLPRLPMPELHDTLRRFEQWCSPLLTKEEFEETRKAIIDFGGDGYLNESNNQNNPKSSGDILHAELQAYNKKPGVHSWLDEFWPARYLGRRDSISINANFVLLFVNHQRTQIQQAARIIGGGVLYAQRLAGELIPPLMSRDKPLCMSQNKYLFSTTRIPGKVRDSSKTPYSDESPGASQARHVLLIHKHQLFKFEVIDENGNAYSTKKIETALEAIKKTITKNLPDDISVGYFTTLPRTDWAELRVELLNEDSKNKKQMDIIEQALFCLCLDDDEPDGLCKSTDLLLHGDGGNRWFDKSISLIVFKNGNSGINIEHCGLDGTVVMNFVRFLHSEETISALDTQAATDNDNESTIKFSEIIFSLNEKLSSNLLKASSSFKALANNTATAYYTFDEFGTQHIKSLKLSPDAFIQLGLQLAHFRTKGIIGATYESVANLTYERGRTEAMRVVTAEVVDFVNTMQDSQKTNSEKCLALRTAAKKHSERLRECQMGEAPEQHLWQLQLLAKERGKALGTPDSFSLFESPGWLKLRSDSLSTSSVPPDNITACGFGATSENCIGLAYLTRPNLITAYLSTPLPVAHHMQAITKNITIAFKEMAELLKE